MYWTQEDMIAGNMTPKWVEYFVAKYNETRVYNRDYSIEILRGTFASYTPTWGYISWSGVQLTYGGKIYDITDGSSSDEWIYWTQDTSSVFSTASTRPDPSITQVIIGQNSGGKFVEMWKQADRSAVAASFETDISPNPRIVGVGASLTAYSDETTEVWSISNDGTASFTEGMLTSDRGDPSSSDFDKTDLTPDGDWHDLDLSDIVPSGNHEVTIRFRGIMPAGDYRWAVGFRRNGSTNAIAAEFFYFVSDAGDQTTHYATYIVFMDSNRVVEYQITESGAGWTSLDFTVAGYRK
jgi:hypothetical protein